MAAMTGRQRRADRRRQRRSDHFEGQLQSPDPRSRLEGALAWIKAEMAVLEASHPEQAAEGRTDLATQLGNYARELHRRNRR